MYKEGKNIDESKTTIVYKLAPTYEHTRYCFKCRDLADIKLLTLDDLKRTTQEGESIC